MNEETRNKMLRDYSHLRFKGPGACVKYYYVHNDVNVNLYFDAFDNDSLSLTLILSTERQFYFTTLNIMNTSLRKEYLPELPPLFYPKVIVDNKLDNFYEHMQEKIMEMNPYRTNYMDDKIFANTCKFQKGEIDLPFLWHIRKTRMTPDMLEQLHERMHISRKVLYQIQQKGCTLVRTADIAKRCTLKLILDGYGIELD